ncbi:MAG: hypothetical protein EZS28_038286 [Streblomastix strix]|uniref:Uncharacterized protein n=1 Tax=Streblomastix strix TaxID=222440 RepID=A0A5J4U6G3_9EUKA|nr:MAG: hypothetical protein EZS28_038286 [Streblomastix strix]
MAVAVGMFDGCQVNNNEGIRSALSNIGCFFNRIHEGRKIYYEDIDGYISFPLQPELAKHSEEQIEEEGGNEEIEALLINEGRKKFDDDSINDRAIRAKYAILNFFSEPQNGQQTRNEIYQYDEEVESVSEYNAYNNDDEN